MQKIKLTLFVLFLVTLLVNCKKQYPYVVMETSQGNIKIKLYDSTYQHSENFIKLVNEGYFNGNLFHRVIKNFMIQSGDASSINAEPGVSLGHGGKDYTIDAEFFPEYYHKKGALAAARQGDNINPTKASSGSQFYIVIGTVFTPEQLSKFQSQAGHPPFSEEQTAIYSSIGGTPHLDYNYTVFGEVIEGLEIIDAISVVPTDKRDRPLKDVKIIRAYLVKK